MKLSNFDLLALYYHDRFDYPLTKEDLEKWRPGKVKTREKKAVSSRNGYYFFKGRGKLIERRLENEKFSRKKLEKTKAAANLFSTIPSIKMVGITGSIAMMNATRKSDIDLIVITMKGTLWLTRFWAYLLLKIYGYEVRKPGDSNQWNKFCMNMWLDESDLVWPKNERNYYSSHEFAQIIPIINKDNTYEKLLQKNKWILDFWPNAVKITDISGKEKYSDLGYLVFFEKFAYLLQRIYMKKRVTKEVITKTRAIFHPRINTLDKLFKSF